ncbi:zinc finger protein 91-like [Photinus pyralis]|uniref:C2H2-type domain-containing protein n=1 Tax=Photinus pyralis TaxID=7054 RepID=A0A1Y1K9Q2_PHOPY|nr:zinc finger protein 91-like [Photinus pyralis]
MDANSIMCRLCLKLIPPNAKCHPLKEQEEILKGCLLDIDLTIPINPCCCEQCLQSLKSTYAFKEQCVGTERLVLQLRAKSLPFEEILNYTDGDVIKQEAEHLEIVNNVDIAFNTEISSCFIDEDTRCSTPCVNQHELTKSKHVYRCHDCAYRTKQKNVLLKHLVVHAKDYRPFKCDQCTFSARWHSLLRDHVEIHPKCFSCEKCRMRFSLMTDLARHVRDLSCKSVEDRFNLRKKSRSLWKSHWRKSI